MRKNVLISLILIVLILMNTVSYATTEPSLETLKTSITKIFSKDIEIHGEFESGTSNSKHDAMQVEIDDSKIVITEEGAENFEPISFVIEDNICKFNHEYVVNVNEESTTEDAFAELMKIMLQQSMIQRCYLATADAMGIDLSLAYTYYSQKSSANNQETTEEKSNSVVDEVFKQETIVSEDEMQYTTYLEVDLQKMKELDETDLDSSSKFTVTLVGLNEEEENEPSVEQECEHSYVIKYNETQHWEECTKCNEQKTETLENHILGNYVDNGDGTQTSTCSKCGYKLTKQKEATGEKEPSKDPTIANKDIPKAGAKNIIFILISTITVLVISVLKIKKYKNI